ncbi:DNA-directed primase/polymerase protein [Fopius arisanus]|uniref:DNA-directed primase/polymerase protein n=2 Tax=Fopius arisanus TaxID=64838 RepID=A0A0C9RFE2_9HYME|nr:PREDICTED: DNA-directed primase/polymerase protein-like [Fopius arisanus]
MGTESATFTPMEPSTFYPGSAEIKKRVNDIEEKCQRRRLLLREASGFRPTLLGPSTFSEKYYKQADALEAAREHSTRQDPLCTFVYQDHYNEGRRMFIVAHPEVYWHSFIRQKPERRCTYEVIAEGAPCWLYLDLEFQTSLNSDSNGPSMTKTLLEIICAFLKKYWDLQYTDKNVLNLDSSTRTKFSRHLIFCTKNVAFKHNIHAGRFIKSIISEIEEYVASNGSAFHEVLSFFPLKDLAALFVETGKKKTIFVDTMVYTKNRHFRIFKATKWGKLSHLEVSTDCTYEPTDQRKDKMLSIFLDSLISFFPDNSTLTLLEFNHDSSIDIKKFPRGLSQNHRFLTQNNATMTESPYPTIDKFIGKLVHPGHIRCSIYFEDSKTVIYEILGNRFCANINRHHKSNNIYFVVDLKEKIYYQKCHDEEDCPGFRSNFMPLPVEICFLLDEEDDDIFFNIPDSDESHSSIRCDISIEQE